MTLIQYRQLWVGHLATLTTSISSLLEIVISSQSVSLQQILRRVSAQLIDLAPSLAMILVQLVLLLLFVLIIVVVAVLFVLVVVVVYRKVASKILAQIDSEDDTIKEIDNSVSSVEKKETR